VTPLVSGRSQNVVALGLGCLFLVVDSISVNWLPAAMYDLTKKPASLLTFLACTVVEFLLLISQSGTSCSVCEFSKIGFHVLCLVGVLLQLTFLSGHGAGVLCILGI